MSEYHNAENYNANIMQNDDEKFFAAVIHVPLAKK